MATRAARQWVTALLIKYRDNVIHLGIHRCGSSHARIPHAPLVFDIETEGSGSFRKSIRLQRA